LPALLARQRRTVERELLGDRAEHALREVFVRILLEELGTERRNDLVVDARLQLTVRVVAANRLLDLDRRQVQIGGGFGSAAVETVVETHRQLLAKLGRRRAPPERLASSFGNMPFAMPSIAREKSEPGSSSTAGTPLFTDSGTARSEATS